MGFSPNSQSKTNVPTALAEINVTPLVDVMLVLLIIFMISAPLMQQGVQVDLPKAHSGNLNDVPDQIVLIIDARKEITLNGKSVLRGTLRNQLLSISQVKPDVQVFVQADQKIPYGFIAQVIAEVKQAKIQRVGLVTLPADPGFQL